MSAMIGAAPVLGSAAAHAGGDEDHVGAVNVFGDALFVFQSGAAADFRIRAGAKAFGERRPPELHLHWRRIHLQRLQIGVRGHELDAAQTTGDHRPNGVSAAAADADDFQLSGFSVSGVEFNHVSNLRASFSIKLIRFITPIFMGAFSKQFREPAMRMRERVFEPLPCGRSDRTSLFLPRELQETHASRVHGAFLRHRANHPRSCGEPRRNR